MVAAAFDLPRASRLIGAFLIAITGLIHLQQVPHHFEAAEYIGWLFWANFLASLVAVVGIYRDARWGWWLGLLIAGASLVFFVISRVYGLPGIEQEFVEEFVGHWTPMGILSLIVEGLFVLLFLVVIATELTRAQRA